jgi:hypothetical protein
MLRVFRDHNARYARIDEQRFAVIKAATALPHDPGIIVPIRLSVRLLFKQLAPPPGRHPPLRSGKSPHTSCPRRRHPAGRRHPVRPPPVRRLRRGSPKLPTVDSLCQDTSIAPLTTRSGTKKWVHSRYRCPKFLRQSFVEWADESTRHSFRTRAFYRHQREKKTSHQMAVRVFAFKWIYILWRWWPARRPYDEAGCLMRLKAKRSPLNGLLANQPNFFTFYN